jgi:hypothetical protein
MIDKDGDTKIMDSGVARSLEAKGITDAEAMTGNPEYISPIKPGAEEAD